MTVWKLSVPLCHNLAFTSTDFKNGQQNFPVCFSVCVRVKIGFTPWLPIYCEKTQSGSHSHAYTGPFYQYTPSQMCCNVMLCVINTVVCLTAPTDQGNGDHTHTDIRVFFLLLFFWFNNKDRGLIQWKKKMLSNVIQRRYTRIRIIGIIGTNSKHKLEIRYKQW